MIRPKLFMCSRQTVKIVSKILINHSLPYQPVLHSFVAKKKELTEVTYGSFDDYWYIKENDIQKKNHRSLKIMNYPL